MATLYHWGDSVLDEEATYDRIEQAFDKIEERVDEIVAIAYDGCHKVYLALDSGEAEAFRRYGYGDGEDSEFLWASTLHTVSIMDTLQHWYHDSCGLRFVTAIKDGQHEDIIPQLFTSEDGE